MVFFIEAIVNETYRLKLFKLRTCSSRNKLNDILIEARNFELYNSLITGMVDCGIQNVRGQ